MANRFRKIGSLSHFLKAGEEAVRFQEAYRRDPVKAVAQYSHLFDSDWMGLFTMRATPGDRASEWSFEVLWKK
ncbi:hypothetical protein D3C86_1945940 [compost metagenome]